MTARVEQRPVPPGEERDAIVMRDAVFVSYVAQLGWLQRMASDVKAAIAFVVGISALLQMLFFVWRVLFVD